MEDKELIEIFSNIKPFLSSKYRHKITEQIKKLTPAIAEVIPGGEYEKMICCPKCGHVICWDDELEDLRDCYDFKSLYCRICGQPVDVSGIEVEEDDE